MDTRNNDICEIDNECRGLRITAEDQEIEYLRPIFRCFDSNSYKIVSNKCYKTVQYEVSNLIDSGWKPYKRIVVTCCNDYVIYTQALIKTAITH